MKVALYRLYRVVSDNIAYGNEQPNAKAQRRRDAKMMKNPT